MNRICIICESEFILLPNHVGYANRCLSCNENVAEPERLGATVRWEGKHTPVLEITTLKEAKKFNQNNVRFGTSILSSISQGKETNEEREVLGMNSGATPGAEYTSKLREKRNLKR
jgi:starvation-inducible outer membrane lipoprotein